MKNKYTVLMFLITVSTLLNTRSINGKVGCMDNSWHLKKAYDYKTYHYVYCSCPCEKEYEQLSNRGQCWKCHHYHEPQNIEIIQVSTK